RLNSTRLRRQRLDNLIDFIKAGKESYYIVSKFDLFDYANAAPLFGKLAARFEDCVCGLNMVKNELDVMQHPIANTTRELFMQEVETHQAASLRRPVETQHGVSLLKFAKSLQCSIPFFEIRVLVVLGNHNALGS